MNDDVDRMSERVALIVLERGYKRVEGDGFLWLGNWAQVELGVPPGTARSFPWVVSRRRLEVGKLGAGVLHRPTVTTVKADASAEEIAEAIVTALEG